ncbi:MAG TPA: diacylglycerol kinase [bacterium]|jgi:diacylglycerol kinase|nr:diacylglycerol kinase [bacterium]
MSGLAGAIREAIAGWALAWREHHNLRIHAAAAVGVVAVILVLRLSAQEAAILLLAVALVIAAELANTAVEILVDAFVGSERHPAARAAKDVAAASVLVAAIGAAAAGLAVLVPRLR